ncbi:hypothetical protein Pd630_LPD16014 (plasmid) [Rhodococcus opacus PD630]|nr:hypothetical protein Pd630_LPD16014 [Rhodococcus opacus PD630]
MPPRICAETPEPFRVGGLCAVGRVTDEGNFAWTVRFAS